MFDSQVTEALAAPPGQQPAPSGPALAATGLPPAQTGGQGPLAPAVHRQGVLERQPWLLPAARSRRGGRPLPNPSADSWSCSTALPAARALEENVMTPWRSETAAGI